MTAHPNRSSIGNAIRAPLHVVIIGGGIGGLTLAQGLKKSRVSAAVYERDRTRTDRVQGYRVHINPTGSLALHECLPAPQFEAFTRTCGRPAGGICFVTEQMKVLLALDGRNAPPHFRGEGVAQHRSVSRITLRQVLLSGLEDTVYFGKTFVRYEENPLGPIVAHPSEAQVVGWRPPSIWSASRSAWASRRSRVSRPSVNQARTGFSTLRACLRRAPALPEL